MKDKKYLSKELIDLILRKSRDPIWNFPILAAFTKNWTDIVTVSPLKLIHILGNSDTGWQHIQDRHNIFSDVNYFGKGKSGNPSKFSRSSTPIYDYVRISDDVFNMGQLQTKNHADSEIFEKYVGFSNRYKGSEGKKMKFHLVLYRSTKIVHSVYPEKDLDQLFPERKIKQFARCRDKIQIVRKLDHYITVYIPYENSENIIRYVITVRIEKTTMIGKVYLQVNALNGMPLFTYFPEIEYVYSKIKLPLNLQEINIDIHRFFNSFGMTTFTKTEELIMTTEDKIKNSVGEKYNDFPESKLK